MKKITNTYNKKMIFPALDFSIDTNEIKSVPDNIFRKLIQNVWIKEVISNKDKPKKRKGRKHK